MKSSLSTCQIVCVILFCFTSLVGCGEAGKRRSGTYAMVIPESMRSVLKGKDIELIISKDDLVTFSGKRGVLQNTSKRSKIVFNGDQAEMFRDLKKGMKEKESVYFWLEFTDSGNCVLYDTEFASFYIRKEPEELTSRQK